MDLHELLTWNNIGILIAAASPGLLVAIVNIIVTSVRDSAARRRNLTQKRADRRREVTLELLASLSAQVDCTANPIRSGSRVGEVETHLLLARVVFDSTLTDDQIDVKNWVSSVSKAVRYDHLWAVSEDFEETIAAPLLHWQLHPTETEWFQLQLRRPSFTPAKFQSVIGSY